MSWSPQDWRTCPIAQAPDYTDAAALDAVETELRTAPPLIFAGEARALKAQLAHAASGEAFPRLNPVVAGGRKGAQSGLSFSCKGVLRCRCQLS